MVEARGIEGISFSFTAGVAAAAVLDFGPEPGGSVCLALACAVAGTLAILKPRGILPYFGLFFILGAFCLSAGELPHKVSNPFSAQFQGLCRRIDGLPFASPLTGSLSKALLCGDRTGLDSGVKEAFRNSGASHILALSGMHLGLIYALVSALSRALGNSVRARRARAAANVTACGWYTVMTGAGPSVLRAFIFICLNEISRLCPGRRRSPAKIYCIALLVQLCIEPSGIRTLSFQLSYLAMCGITLVFPILQNWYPARKGGFSPTGRIWTCIAMSVSCQLFTAPLVWLKFRTFPGYFLLSNLIALPLTEGLMGCSLACLAADALGLPSALFPKLADTLCGFLAFSMETISSM